MAMVDPLSEQSDDPVAKAAPVEKELLLKRLHRVQGQLRGIEKMVAADRDCVDILTQVAAANTALESFALVLLDQYINQSVLEARNADDDIAARAKSRELIDAMRRFAKTR